MIPPTLRRCSFFFWLDLAGTVSLVFDVPWLMAAIADSLGEGGKSALEESSADEGEQKDGLPDLSEIQKPGVGDTSQMSDTVDIEQVGPSDVNTHTHVGNFISKSILVKTVPCSNLTR